MNINEGLERPVDALRVAVEQGKSQFPHVGLPRIANLLKTQ